MCIILFAWQSHPRYPLLVAANRDEFHHRPAEAARWRGGVFCGLDLSAGGTWLGVTREGRFAAVTNFREPVAERVSDAARSRGDLPLHFLQGGETPSDYAARIAEQQDAYRPFNLLVGDGDQLWYLSNRGAAPQPVAPGVHGLSNGLLDTPWPKVTRGKEKLAHVGQGEARPEHLLALLHDDWRPEDDHLPDTGVGPELERLVAPIFIRSPQYGTRASSAVRLGVDGEVTLLEQGWQPDGTPQGAPRDSREGKRV